MKKITFKGLRSNSPKKECHKQSKEAEQIVSGSESFDFSLPSPCTRSACSCQPSHKLDYCSCCQCLSNDEASVSPKRKSKSNLFNSLRKKFAPKQPFPCQKEHESRTMSSNHSAYASSCQKCSQDNEQFMNSAKKAPYRSQSAERPKSYAHSDSSRKGIPKSVQLLKKSNTISLHRKPRHASKHLRNARTLDTRQVCDSDSEDEATDIPKATKLNGRHFSRPEAITNDHTRRLNDLARPFDGYGHASSPKCNDLTISDGARGLECNEKSDSSSPTSSDGDMEDAPATLSRDLTTLRHYDKVKERTREPWSLTKELTRLVKHGWYWGPITRLEADEKLANQQDGAFLVRDSSDERYLLSLSFRSHGRTLHTRIEHCNGVFSFYAQPESEGYCSIVELIDHSMNDSQTGVFYYSRARTPGAPSFPVRLTKPVSRFTHVRSLQYLCRFVIRQTTRVDHIQKLPLPSSIRGWLQQKQY